MTTETKNGSLHGYQLPGALQFQIKSIKKEFDFYDEGTELGNMFPNGQDGDSDD